MSLFREKIKSKFNYANIVTESVPQKAKPEVLKAPSRRTQTFAIDCREVDYAEFDPFGDEETLINDEDDQLSQVDPAIAQGIFNKVINGLEDSAPNIGNLTQSQDDYDSEDYNKFGTTKKRKRDGQFTIDKIAGQVSVDEVGAPRFDKMNMVDNLNRSVTKKGYLTDKEGNIINQNGEVIFDHQTVEKHGGDIPQ